MIPWLACAAAGVLAGATPTTAPPAASHATSTTASGHDATDLAKQTQNPVADLASVPLQFNFTTGGDLGARTSLTFNFQPVLPLKVNPSWNVIVRTIIPLVSIALPGGAREWGLGDIQQQLFFAPAHSSGVTWGMGPVLSYPTATSAVVSSGEWGLGPAGVLVINAGPFVLGAVASNLWRFAGDDTDPDLNLFTVQPFINYNLSGGWSLSCAPIITANWSAPDGEEWTVPLGLGVSKVDSIGKHPVSLSVQYYRNVERPTGAGSDQVRFAISFLFPRPPRP